MDSEPLAHCDLCGCLVAMHTLRAYDYEVTDSVGVARKAVRVACEDTAACFVRANDPGHWERLGAAVPRELEPSEGAALTRCDVCGVVAPLDDLTVSQWWSDHDQVWYEAMTCTDQDACAERDRRYYGGPVEL